MKNFLLFFFLSHSLISISFAKTEENNILELKASNSCELCILEGANLGSLDLSKAYLFGADLSGVSLKSTDLSGATFCNTIMPSGVDNSGC